MAMKLVLLLMVGLLLVLPACGERVDEGASGEEIYAAVCARCHGDDLSGGLGPALVGTEATSVEKSEDFLIQAVDSGIGRMPSLGGVLSAAQVQRVVDYVLEQQGR